MVAGIGVVDRADVAGDVGGVEVIDLFAGNEVAVIQVDDVVGVLNGLHVDGDGTGGHGEAVIRAVDRVGGIGEDVHIGAAGLVDDIDLGDQVAVVSLGGKGDLVAHVGCLGLAGDLSLFLDHADGVVDGSVLHIDRHGGSGHMEEDGVGRIQSVGHGRQVLVGIHVEVLDGAVSQDVVDLGDLVACIGGNNHFNAVLVGNADAVFDEAVHLHLAVSLGGGILLDGVELLGKLGGDDHIIGGHIEVVLAVLDGQRAVLLAVVIGDGDGGQIIAGVLLDGEADALSDNGLAVGRDLVDLHQGVGVVHVLDALNGDLALAGQLGIKALHDGCRVLACVGLVGLEVAGLHVNAVVDGSVDDVDGDFIRDHREGELGVVRAGHAVDTGHNRVLIDE